MRLDFIAIVICECIAAVVWAICFKKLRSSGFRLFAVYLCIITAGELMNLLSGGSKWSNDIVIYFNVPLQFIFLIWFLICVPNKKLWWFALTLIAVYLACYIAERLNLNINPINFDSFSYGVGNLLLMTALVIALVNVFNSNDLRANDQTGFFIILIGMMIFYIGGFPYGNFRSYFWSKPAYYNLAYILHYISQTFNCIMYLLFALAVRWKIK